MHRLAYAAIGAGVVLEGLDVFDGTAAAGNSPTLDSIKNFNESFGPAFYLHIGTLLIVAGAVILLTRTAS